jgi:hypothetical protein
MPHCIEVYEVSILRQPAYDISMTIAILLLKKSYFILKHVVLLGNIHDKKGTTTVKAAVQSCSRTFPNLLKFKSL